MNVKKSHLFLIAAVAFLIYLPSLFFGFTYFDDQVLVLENQSFLTQWINIFVAFNREVFHSFGGGAGYYRPLLTVSFIWDALFAGASPFMYHLTNIILHVVASCLVYLVLNQLAPRTQNSVFLSLLFAFHPIMVQAVSWIPGRNDSLLGVFILLSFLFFLKAQNRDNSELRTQNLEHRMHKDNNSFFAMFYVLSSKFNFWHLFFFLCALFTKETALVFLFLLFFWILAFNNLASNLKLVFGWIFCVLIFLVVKQNVIGSLATGMTTKDIFWSVWKNFPAVFLYVGKIFIPVNLSVLPILQDSNIFLGIGVLLFLCVILLIFSVKSKFKRPNYRFLLFGLLWFFAFLLPSFVRPDLNGIADFLEHRIYLSFVGILFIIQDSEFNIQNSKWLKSFLMIIFATLGLITIIHQFSFRDRLAFWTQAVADAPHSSLAHKNLGAMLYLNGNQASAFNEFQIAGQLNPKEPIVHNNLGLIYVNKGEFDKAEAEYKQELKINPTYDNAYYNYGLLKYKMGKPADAEKLWQKTVEFNPGYVDAWKNLINLEIGRNNQEKAQMYLMKARSIGLQF